MDPSIEGTIMSDKIALERRHGARNYDPLPMTTGAEGVETAIKCVRKWAYNVKKVPRHEAEIIVCDGNFHGRTTTIVGFSSEPQYREGFGPYSTGFRHVPFGDARALEV